MKINYIKKEQIKLKSLKIQLTRVCTKTTNEFPHKIKIIYYKLSKAIRIRPK